MKFDNLQESSVEIVGDIKENKVGIRAEDAEHLIMVLSSNLYSNPIGSTVREIVSNAWDAHVEAGNTDPVIINFYKTVDNTFQIIFQDFGVGLSPERFDSVYKNIGASTKRDSNGQIGGFGIGKFAPLSYTNMITIISNYDGKQYLYIIHKDGTSVSIDLITESDTQEPNGVSIQINLEQEADLPRFTQQILTQLSYFENIHIENRLYRTQEELMALDQTYDSYDSEYIQRASRDINTFNNLKIKKFQHYAINSGLEGISKSTDVIIGRVRYPLDMNQLSFNAESLFPEVVEAWEKVQGNDYSSLAFLNPPISLICDIGELNITPNREQILYSKHTKDILTNKYVLAIAEFLEKYKPLLEGDYFDLKAYVKMSLSDKSVNLFDNEEGAFLNFKFPREFTPKFTLNGKFYSKFEIKLFSETLHIGKDANANTFSYQSVFNPVGYYANGTFTQSRLPQYHHFNYSQKFSSLYSNRNKIVILDKPFSALSQLDKFYFKSLGGEYLFTNIKSFTYKRFLNMMIRILRETSYYDALPSKLKKIKDEYNKELYPDTLNTLEKRKKKDVLEYRYFMKIARVMLRYILPIGKTIYLHKTENIPKDVEQAYKEDLKRRRDLREKNSYNEVLSIEETVVTVSNMSNNTKTLSTEKPYTEKIQVLFDKAKKGTTFIHYNKNNQQEASFIKALAYWFLPQFKPNTVLISVAPTKRKLLKDVHKNIISMEDMMQDSKILKNIVTALYISIKFPQLAEIYQYNRAYIQAINEDLYDKLEKTASYFKYIDAISFNSALIGLNSSSYMIKSFKKEILEKGLAEKNYHLAVKENFDLILPDLKKLFTVLDMFRTKEGNNFGSIPLSSIPIIIDFLHRNKIIKIPLQNLIKSRLEVKYLLNNNS